MKETGTIIFNSSVVESVSDETIEWRDTTITYLPNVTRYNWTQAQTAWHAIDEVPEMEPGKLVTNGLVAGHDEQVVTTESRYPFRGQINGLRSVSESQERILRAYTFEEKSDTSERGIVRLDGTLQRHSGNAQLFVIKPAPEAKKIA